MQQLFPEESLDTPLTAITLSQKTENDMSGWSEAVEMEREALMAQVTIRVASQNHLIRNQWRDILVR